MAAFAIQGLCAPLSESAAKLAVWRITPVIYHSVAEILEDMDETFLRLCQSVQELSDTQESWRPDFHSWSIKEIVEHLSIVEDRVFQLTGMLLKKAEAAGPASGGLSFTPVNLAHLVERSRREKYVAPQNARPRGHILVADSLLKLNDSHAAFHRLRPRFEAVNLSAVTYPHPVFGALDLAQWLAFIGVHEQRHLGQIESILALPGLAIVTS